MQHFKRSSTTFFPIILTVTMLADPVLAQSGRTRPRVAPPPTPSTVTPEPVNVPANTAVKEQEQIGTLSRFVLRNGITVMISEQHSTPIVAAVACFKADPLEGPDALGARRVLARASLRGTQSRPGPGALAELRSVGAELQAWASLDYTAFSLLAPADKINEALAIESDILQHPLLDAEVIRREIALADVDRRDHLSQGLSGWTNPAAPRAFGFDDSADYSLNRVLSLALWNQSSNSVSAMTRDQLVEFHRTHFRPDNLIIAIAGDVSTFNVLVGIQRSYAGFGANPEEPLIGKATGKVAMTATVQTSAQKLEVQPAGEAAAETGRAPASGPERLRYLNERADISRSLVSVAFPVPAVDQRDSAAIDALAAIAGLGRSSRLNRSLIDDQKVANRIQAEYLQFARQGVLSFRMQVAIDSPAGAALDKAEAALFKELTRLRSEPPTESELARAKSALEKKYLDQTSTFLGRAHSLARAAITGMGLRSALDHADRISSVRAEDVQRVASKYLTLSNTSIHEYEPLTAPSRTFDSDGFAATVKAWSPGFDAPRPVEAARAPESKPAPPAAQQNTDRRFLMESIEPLPVKDFSTLNGPKAFVREDHSQPKVTVAILFQGGRLVEDAATSGTTELMLRAMLYGTPRRGFSQLNEELDELGADVEIVVQPDFFGIMLSVLSRNAERALKLVRDQVEEPAFRDEDVARARLGQVAAIREARDSSFHHTRQLLLEALFPGHPYSLPPHGREEVIKTLTGEKLTEWHARSVKRQLPVAIIVGDTAGSALVSAQLAEGFRRRDLDASIPVKIPKPVTATEKADGRREPRTAVAIGFPGPKVDNQDQFAIQLIESALNGEGGRLMRELRDKQGIADSARLDQQAMFAAGVISCFASASPDSEQRARDALLSELERIARGGLEDPEVSAARAIAMTSRTARLQSQSELAIEYGGAVFYQKQASGAQSFGEQVSKISADDIKRIAAGYFKSAAACAGIVRGSSTPSTSALPKQD